MFPKRGSNPRFFHLKTRMVSLQRRHLGGSRCANYTKSSVQPGVKVQFTWRCSGLTRDSHWEVLAETF